jgi:Type II site-specific deoxyribonuclease
MADPNVLKSLQASLAALTQSQIDWVGAVIKQFRMPYVFDRLEDSDVVTAEVLETLGDALRIHHAFSRQALSKDRFEYAFESSLNRSGIPAELVRSRTNRGYDITIRGVPASLKTQADKGIRLDRLHISKFMELGKGAWELPLLREMFERHMDSYERIFQFRCLLLSPSEYCYELVEIPKALLAEVMGVELKIMANSRQTPQPGYGKVFDAEGKLKFELYFDAGTERKLTLPSECVSHNR